MQQQDFERKSMRLPTVLEGLADNLIPSPEGYPSASLLLREHMIKKRSVAAVCFVVDFEIELDKLEGSESNVGTLDELRLELIRLNIKSSRVRLFSKTFVELLLISYFSDKRILEIDWLLPASILDPQSDGKKKRYESV